MPPTNTRSNSFVQKARENIKPSIAFIIMIFGALIAFEIFNYSTTQHALSDLLGDLSFIGMSWATILALAFCGIDFAGIARLFTPEQGTDEPKEVWYLFGAWLLAATMNAILTWWGVSMAVANHTSQSTTIIDPETLTTVVPVFVAIMVWVIRILIIGTLSLAMDRMLHPGVHQRTTIQNAFSASTSHPRPQVPASQPMSSIPASLNSAAISPQRVPQSRSAAPASRVTRSVMDESDYNADAQNRARPEPTYHSLSVSSRPAVNTQNNSADPSGSNRYRKS
jgi:hypothetical protein